MTRAPAAIIATLTLLTTLTGCATFYRPPARPGGEIHTPGHRTPPAGERAALLQAAGYLPIHLEAEDSTLTGPFYLLHIRANGKKARAAIDTGATVMHIPPDFAEKIGVPLRPTRARALSVAGETNVKAGTIAHLETPAFTWHNVPVAADKQQRNGILLGINELSGLGALVDYANNVLWIAPDARHAPRPRHAHAIPSRRLAATLHPAGFTKIPLTEWDEHWIARVHINGKPERLLVDTGAQLTVLFGRTARHHHLAPLDSPFLVAGANTANRRAKAVALHHLALGHTTIRNLLAVVLPMEELIRAIEASGDRSPGGILGADILERSQALLDCASGHLYLPATPK